MSLLYELLELWRLSLLLSRIDHFLWIDTVEVSKTIKIHFILTGDGRRLLLLFKFYIVCVSCRHFYKLKMKFVCACNDILTSKLSSFAFNSILLYLWDIHVIFWEIHTTVEHTNESINVVESVLFMFMCWHSSSLKVHLTV